MRHRRRSVLALASVPILAIALAACGSSNNSNSSSSTAATNASSGGTVSVQSVSGVGAVLVDSQGNTLYTNTQHSGPKVACTGQCTGIWQPLGAPSSGQPTSSDSSAQAK